MPRHTEAQLADAGRAIVGAVDDAIARMVAKDPGTPPRDGRYHDSRTTGFVVRKESIMGEAGRPPRTDVSWWYGEGEGTRGRGFYWNTWGSLDGSVAWFDTKVKAKLATRRCSLANQRGVRIVSVEDAKAELAGELEGRAASLLARAAFLRGAVQ